LENEKSYVEKLVEGPKKKIDKAKLKKGAAKIHEADG